MADPIATLGGAFLVELARATAPRAPHRHAALEFNLVVRGSARLLVGQHRHDLVPGSIAWMFPGQDHVLVDESRDLRVWLAFFHLPALRVARPDGRFAPLLLADPPGDHCRRLGADDARRVRSLCEVVSGGMDEAAVLAPALAHLAVAAWDATLRAPVEAVPRDVHPAVARAAAALARDDGADLASVSARAGLSHSRLRHLFRAQTGTTLAAYRNRQRLRRFLALPAARRGLLERALAAGFGSYAQFHRVFRAAMGVSPAAWDCEHG